MNVNGFEPGNRLDTHYEGDSTMRYQVHYFGKGDWVSVAPTSALAEFPHVDLATEYVTFLCNLPGRLPAEFGITDRETGRMVEITHEMLPSGMLMVRRWVKEDE